MCRFSTQTVAIPSVEKSWWSDVDLGWSQKATSARGGIEGEEQSRTVWQRSVNTKSPFQFQVLYSWCRSNPGLNPGPGTNVSRSSNNSHQNNSRRFISWRFTNHEPCAICFKNMNTKSFIAYKINIIACACALQLPFIPTSESGEINSQHLHEFFSFKFIHLIENCIPFIHLFRLKKYNWKVYLNAAWSDTALDF